MACHRASRVQLHGRGSPTSRLPAHGGHGVRSSYGSISGRTRQDATNTGNAVRREIHVMCRVWVPSGSRLLYWLTRLLPPSLKTHSVPFRIAATHGTHVHRQASSLQKHIS